MKQVCKANLSGEQTHFNLEEQLLLSIKVYITSKLNGFWHERTDVVEVVKGLTHLNAHQEADLLQVLQENNKMCEGTLGVYLHIKVHIDIDPNAKPVHSSPYPVPQIHLKNFKMELDHYLRIGVLASQHKSEWASP